MKKKTKKEKKFYHEPHEPTRKGERGIEPECSCKPLNAKALLEKSRRRTRWEHAGGL
jgi:hypothetical protein